MFKSPSLEMHPGRHMESGRVVVHVTVWMFALRPPEHQHAFQENTSRCYKIQLCLFNVV